MDRRTRTIANLNDDFRRSLQGGDLVLTPGIHALPEADQISVLAKVRAFKDFNEANNPRGERTYGSFDQGGQRVSWKIDCYDADDMTGASPDPSDPARTHRVLTIMLPEEY